MKAPIKTKPGATDFSGVPTRPQKPADAYGHGNGHWEPGQVPMGGFRAVIPFSTHNEKLIPTSRPETGHRVTKK